MRLNRRLEQFAVSSQGETALMPHPAPVTATDLRIGSLVRRFGTVIAVDSFNLTVPAGQFVGIVGRSGAGKSTLLRLINRLIEADTGSIHYGTIDVTTLRGDDLRQWRARAAMIFQQFNLIPRLDVLTNVLTGRLQRHGTMSALLGRFSAKERTEALLILERFGLLDVALQRAGTLSGGQQQRVAICRALLQEPWLVLADEPIASLDPHNARVVMQALKRINQEDGLTVLANLHHLDVVRTYCDRVVGMRDGRLIFDGTPAELTADHVFAIYGVTEEKLLIDGASG